ncbi:MAG: aminotransferase class IV [Bacteroidota bacterium]
MCQNESNFDKTNSPHEGMGAVFFLNGLYLPENEANIHITDLGLLRGYGIFDFFRAVDGKVLFIEDHLDRFEFSASQFQLKIPYSREKLKEIVQELIVLNKASLLGIKMILTGGYSEDGYSPTTPNFLIIAKPFAFMEKPNGMHLMSLEHLRELPEIKSLNYMVPILNRSKMIEMGADDYLYHKNGYISELSRSNVFLVINQKIITPSTNILKGVTRKHILKIASYNWLVEEREVSLGEAFSADEIFTTGSTKKVMPITKLDNQPVGNGKIGKITTELSELFHQYEIVNS